MYIWLFATFQTLHSAIRTVKFIWYPETGQVLYLFCQFCHMFAEYNEYCVRKRMKSKLHVQRTNRKLFLLFEVVQWKVFSFIKKNMLVLFLSMFFMFNDTLRWKLVKGKVVLDHHLYFYNMIKRRQGTVVHSFLFNMLELIMTVRHMKIT
jgi:hypothetical protein